MIFRAAPLGATGGSSSPKLSWNSGSLGAPDPGLSGITGGGPWDLVWNGSSNIVFPGVIGVFTGTDSSGQPVQDPAFQSGDNITLTNAGIMNVSNNTIFGILTISNSSGSNAFAGGNIVAASLVKNNPGVLILSNTNSFAAGTISGGTVVADSTFALGANAVNFSGATISFTNPSLTTFSSPLAIGAGGLTMSNAADLTMAGAITGSNNLLTKTGAGTLTLSGPLGANKAGVVLGLSTGSLILTGSAKEIGGSCTINSPVTANGVALNLNQNCSLTGSGLLSLSGATVGAVFGATGSTVTVGLDADFSAVNTLNSPSSRTLRFENGTISGSGLINITGNGTVQMVGTNDSTFSGVINYATTNANSFLLSAQTAENVTAITNTGQLILTNAFAGTEAVVGAAITGSGSLTKDGAGDIVLGPSNSYAGITAVNNGRLIGAATSIPGSASVASGASLVLRQSGDGIFSGAIGGAGSLVKEGGGNVTLGGSNSFTGGTLVNGGTLTVAVVNLAGAVTNNSSLVFNQSGDATFANTISGTGLVAKTGPGTLTLSSSNIYTGGTVVSQGTLRATNISSFGSGSITVETGGTLDLNFLNLTNLVVNNGGTITNANGLSGVSYSAGTSDVSQPNSSITEISGTATVLVSGANTTVSLMSGGSLNVGASGVAVFSYVGGDISVNEGVSVVVRAGNSSGVVAGAGGLIKNSTGTLTFGGSNSIAGLTTVSAGRLVINGWHAAGATIATNTGVLSGAGTVGSTTVSGGGTIAPGSAGVGLINVAGNLKFGGSGNLNWQLQNAVGAAGAGYDHIDVDGALDLGSLASTNKFNINLGTLSGSSGETAGQASNFNKDNPYTWILLTASGGFTGSFNPSHFNINVSSANGAEGFQNSATGGTFSVEQSGNSLVLVYTPNSAGVAGAGPIGIASTPGAPNSVAPGEWYVQTFNAVLPSNGSAPWTNNITLPGWYVATGSSATNTTTNIVAGFPSPTNTAAGTLYSVPQHFDNNTPTSAYRAIAVAPNGTTGPNNLALRFVNNTTNTITGFTVSYEMRWGYSQEGSVDSFDVIAGGSGYSSAPQLLVSGGATNAGGTVTLSGANVSSITKTNSGSGYTSDPVLTFTNGGGSGAIARAIMQLTTSSNAVTLSHKVYNAGTGSTPNVDSNGWTTVTNVVNKNLTTPIVPDNWNYVEATITNVNIPPGQEVWLNWQVAKQGTTGASIAAIDNVRVGNFGRANPAIVVQPLAQSIIMGNSATLAVTASGTGSLNYQWRKNGTNIAGATNPALIISNTQSSDVGDYDAIVSAGTNSVASKVAAVQVYSRVGVIGAVSNNFAVAPALTNYTTNATFFDIPEVSTILTTNTNTSVVSTNYYTNKFDLYLPNAPVPTSGRPAVVVIHGGGGNDGDKADGREVQACQEFASHGYVALSINYRRSSQWKPTGNWSAAWPQNIKDAKTAVRWLRANAAAYGIDPNRIGAIGFSWGGNEAAMLALIDGDPALDPSAEDGLGVQSTKVACAANFYGAVQIPDYHNMNQFSGNGIPGSFGTMDYGGGTNNYLAASPASRASSSAAPMLLHHGDADLEVMPTQNAALRAALDNAGGKVTAVLVPGGKHSYSLYETDSAQGGSTSSPIDVRPHTIGFYDAYLLPRPPVVTSAAAVSAVKSSALSYQITSSLGASTNGPAIFYSASGLTNGTNVWSIDSSTGLLTGVMPVSGSRSVTVYATGPSGTASQTVTFTAVEGLVVSNTVAGKTPTTLGYNLGHFTDNGNGFDWFRSSGVKAARVFLSASELQSQTSPGRSKVTNETSFWNAVNSARTAGTNSTTYIRWSDFNYDYTSTAGANDITFKYAFTQLRGLGAEILVNITASPGTFPIGSTSDWAGKWELWQHYYAQAYLLSRDYGITRFSMFNEPNNWSGMTESDWFQRLRICSDAIQRGIADMNAARTNSLVPRIYAPNTASGKEKYSTAADTWGRDTIVNRYLQLSNVTNSTWTPKTNSVPWSLSHVYNYQKYSMLTHDDGSLTGYVTDITELRSLIDADNGSETVPPMALTEFNSRTGDSYDGKTENQDTPSDYVALGANSVALSANGADELYLFKFGQTESVGVNYGVAKNGTHYVQNASGTANNYGGATKAARVYQLFNKAAVGGRDRYAISTTSGANTNTTSGLWSMAANDADRNLLHVFLANKNSGALPLALNLSQLGVPDGAPVIVEEVGASASGQGRLAGNVAGGQIGLGSLPGSSVWLVTVPRTPSSLFTSEATEDAELADGANRNLANGLIASMKARADGTANGRRAVLLKIPVSSSQVSTGRRFYLDLEVATTSGTSPIQAHVYGVNNDAWSEADITWATSGFLRQNVGTGSQIAYNVASNSGSSAACRILGAVVASSTTPSRTMVDVTDFVKTQTDGYATFLVLQDHRWDYSAEPVSTRTTGDIQAAGLVVSAHEKSGGAARIVAFGSDTNQPPAILSAPSDKYLNVGDTVTLSASVDLSTAVTYQWKKDGQILAGANSATLVISNATAADAGAYTVDVTNASGTTTSSEAVVAINSAPALVSPLFAVNAAAGDPVTLSATFSGFPPPSYVWSKDGVVVAGATESSYSFIASSSTAGSYTVTAQNSAGSASSTAQVSVAAAATGLLSISSLSDGITENFNSLGKSGSYAISGSNYYVWTNGDGWATSASAFTNKPGWYATTDDNRSPFEGFRTANTSGNGNNTSGNELDTTPTRARTGLASTGSSSGDTNRSLGGLAWTNNRVFFGLRIRNNTGTAIQACKVIYKLGQFSSTTTNQSGTKVTVSSAVNVSSLRSPGWVNFATNSQFVYRTSSIRGIDGTSTNNSRRITNDVGNLAVAPGDSLWLRWEISTTTGFPLAMSIDDLVVTNFSAAAAPSILSNPVSVTNVSGTAANFEVVASGQPVPSFQWLKDGTPIEGETGTSLTFSPARAADAGTYTVRVFNLAGTNTSAPATLAVTPRPAAIVEPPVSSAITFGDTLSRSSLSGGAGSVPGVFSFVSPAFAPNAGLQEQQIVFWPEDTANYSAATNSIAVTVNKAPQTISFGPLPAKTFGDLPFALSASATSGLPVSFASLDESVATIANGILTIHGPGSTLIIALQSGNENYLAANSVQQSFAVATGGASFAAEFGGADPASDSDADGVGALVEYALGGATNRVDLDRLPQVSRAGQELSISYLARTNDASLVYRPEAITGLGGSWNTNNIVTTSTGSTNIGSTTYEMRRSSINLTNESKGFLRLKVQIP